MEHGNQYKYQVGNVFDLSKINPGCTGIVIDRWPLNGKEASQYRLKTLYRYRIYRSDAEKHNYDEEYFHDCKLLESSSMSRANASVLEGEPPPRLPLQPMAPMIKESESEFTVITTKDGQSFYKVAKWELSEKTAEREADALATQSISDQAVGTVIYVAKVLSRRACMYPPPQPMLPILEVTRYR